MNKHKLSYPDVLTIENVIEKPMSEVSAGDIGIFANILIVATGPYDPTKRCLPVRVLRTGIADQLMARSFRWVGHVHEVAQPSPPGEDPPQVTSPLLGPGHDTGDHMNNERPFGCWWQDVDCDDDLTVVHAKTHEDAAKIFFHETLGPRALAETVRDHEPVGVVDLETAEARIIGVRNVTTTQAVMP